MLRSQRKRIRFVFGAILCFMMPRLHSNCGAMRPREQPELWRPRRKSTMIGSRSAIVKGHWRVPRGLSAGTPKLRLGAIDRAKQIWTVVFRSPLPAAHREQDICPERLVAGLNGEDVVG